MKEEKDLKNSMYGMKPIDHQEAEEDDQKQQQKIQEFVDAIIDRYPKLKEVKNKGGYIGPAFDGMELEV